MQSASHTNHMSRAQEPHMADGYCVQWHRNKVFALLWEVLLDAVPLENKYIRISLFKIDLIYLLLEKGEGREKVRERNIHVQETPRSVASRAAPTGDLALNPGLSPDQESNW